MKIPSAGGNGGNGGNANGRGTQGTPRSNGVCALIGSTLTAHTLVCS
jgi:hypothetical protein